MSKVYTSELIIDVPIELVWSTLVDIKKWSQWKPGHPWVINNFETTSVVAGQAISYLRATPSSSDKEYTFIISEWSPPNSIVFDWGNGQDSYFLSSFSENRTEVKTHNFRSPEKPSLFEKVSGLAMEFDYEDEVNKQLASLKSRCEIISA